jgi:hypothetical protein
MRNNKNIAPGILNVVVTDHDDDGDDEKMSRLAVHLHSVSSIS